MIMDQLLTFDECQGIAKDDWDIVGTDDTTGEEHIIRWQRKPMALKNPFASINGVTGYCIFDGEAGHRVHICAHKHCKSRFGPSKYGAIGPPTSHLRIKIHWWGAYSS